MSSNYLAVFEQDGSAFGGFVLELNVNAVGKNTEQVQERLEQGMALMLLELKASGLPVPEPRYHQLSDLPVGTLDGFGQVTSALLTPAAVNPVSLEIERAIEASGLSDSEIARRMSTSPSAVGRLQDYFYWGHSLLTLRKLADVLGVRIELKLLAA